MPPISVLIKPASSKCNLKCEYCFYHDVASSRSVSDFGFMSPETIETIIRKVLLFASDQATFSFQGGEPTLCGIDFFRHVVELQKKFNVNNVKINNCVQTNGILIDNEWASFLHEHNFLVGLSFDGPQKLHDRYRVDAKKRGTYERVTQTVKLFNEYKVDYNILFVVTEATARHPDEVYSYFKKRDFRFLQFIPCIDPNNSKRGEHEYSLSPLSYTGFLKRFFDNWYADFTGGREVSIRYFDNLVRIVMGIRPEMCSLLGSCGCQFVFEADGSVYPCDFYVTDEWKLGNIREKELLELSSSETCTRFIESSLSVAPKCNGCKWRVLCKGGCRRDREDPYSKKIGQNYYCKSYYEFLNYAYPRLVNIARNIRQVSLLRTSPVTRVY